MDDARIMNSADRPANYTAPRGVEDLLRRYAAGERHFPDTDLPEGSSLFGAILEGAVFVNSWLSDVDFRSADLQSVRFDHSNLKCSDFRKADLRLAVFPGSLVEATDFEGANLEGANFAGASAYGGTLTAGDVP